MGLDKLWPVRHKDADFGFGVNGQQGICWPPCNDRLGVLCWGQFVFKIPVLAKNASKKEVRMSNTESVRFDGIPSKFEGEVYSSFLSTLSEKRNVKRYIEVGIEDGVNFSKIHAEKAIGVDPNFSIKANVMERKRAVLLNKMTSDVFFSDPKNWEFLAGYPDLIFLDGFHAFEFLLRDVCHAESISDRNGLIFLHDCLPLNAEMTERDMTTGFERGQHTNFPGYWTGDVWKIIPILQKYRPDLRILYLDCPPTGLVALTNLDPQSTTLNERYLEIVDEFFKVANTIENISNIYKSISLTSSKKVSHGFDNTLYFRT